MTVFFIDFPQLELFNERDTESLVNLFSEDATLSDLQTNVVLAQGVAAIRSHYVHYFETPVQCHLLGRLSIGNVVGTPSDDTPSTNHTILGAIFGPHTPYPFSDQLMLQY